MRAGGVTCTQVSGKLSGTQAVESESPAFEYRVSYLLDIDRVSSYT